MSHLFAGKSLALLTALLCACYLGYRIYESKSNAVVLAHQTLEDAVPTVAVVNPKPGASSESITLPGNIVGWYEAPMYARVTGYVKMWYKDYGDRVKKGDILAEINAPDLDAEYAQAKADLDTERARYKLAEVTAQRWVALRPNHAVSEQSITVQEQNLKAEAAKVRAEQGPEHRCVHSLQDHHRPVRRRGHPAQHQCRGPGQQGRQPQYSKGHHQSLYGGRRPYAAPLRQRTRIVRAVSPARPHGHCDRSATAESSFHRQISDRLSRIRCGHTYGRDRLHH